MSHDSSPEHLVIGPDQAGERLDRALAMLLPDLSRTRLKALMLEGAVTLNGKVADNPKHKTQLGDQVSLVLPPPVAAEPAAEAIPLDVVFEDAHLLVIDKPAGVLVVAAPGKSGPTLLDLLSAQLGYRVQPFEAARALSTAEQEAAMSKDIWHRGQSDEAQLRKLLEDHHRWTGSKRARELLDNWTESRGKFVKVFPNEYKRALGELAAKAKATSAAALAKKARAATAK